MIGSSPSQRLADHDSNPMAPRPFLSTHRALSACTRELERLAEEVVDRVKALSADGVEEKPVVRTAPGRCIVQLGPVALTLTWLRSTLDSAADGELLVIVWRGNVAPSRRIRPEEYDASRAPATAKALWERVLIPIAQDEASWVWRLVGSDEMDETSSALAARCVALLHGAYREDQHAA